MHAQSDQALAEVGRFGPFSPDTRRGYLPSIGRVGWNAYSFKVDEVGDGDVDRASLQWQELYFLVLTPLSRKLPPPRKDILQSLCLAYQVLLYHIRRYHLLREGILELLLLPVSGFDPLFVRLQLRL